MSAIESYRDQSHDRGLISQTNSELDASTKSGYALISPRLDTLGLHMQEPVKSVCGEGDPALYKYSCYTEALINEVDRQSMVGDVNQTVQKLVDLDTVLVKNGWERVGNDFRRPNKPVDQWASAINAYIVQIEYQKGRCSLDFLVASPNAPVDSGIKSLSCAASLLPGFYY